MKIIKNFVCIALVVVMNIGHCWGMEESATSLSLMPAVTALSALKDLVLAQNERFASLERRVEQQNQLPGSLQHEIEKNRVLLELITKIDKTVKSQNSQLEDLHSKWEGLQKQDEERAKELEQFITKAVEAGLVGADLLLSGANFCFAAIGTSLREEMDQKKSELYLLEQKNIEQEKKSSDLQMQIAQLQSTVDVLIQLIRNSGMPINLTATETGGSVTTEQVAQTVIQETTTVNQSNVLFFCSKQFKMLFCSIFILGVCAAVVLKQQLVFVR